MCTRAERLAGLCKTVPAGCGYKASVGANSIVIYPTTNYANCHVTLGIGDAIFQIDPKNPPTSLKVLLTGDAKGDYVPKAVANGSRVTKSFTGVTMTTQSHTDADGVVTTFQIPVLDDYQEKSAEGTYLSQGYYRGVNGGVNRRIDW